MEHIAETKSGRRRFNGHRRRRKIVFLGQVDVGVDNVLARLDRNAIAYEFPRHAPPKFLNSSIHDQRFVKKTRKEKRKTKAQLSDDEIPTQDKSKFLRKVRLSDSDQKAYCGSPNAFYIPPKIFKRSSNYLFSGNVFYVSGTPAQKRESAIGGRSAIWLKNQHVVV